MAETFGELFSKLSGYMFFWSTIQQLVPENFRFYVENLWDKLVFFFYPYIHSTFYEYTGGMHTEAYTSIKSYLGAKSSKQAKCFVAGKFEDSKSFAISLQEGEEIIDEFEGIELRWQAYKETIKGTSARHSGLQEKKYYVLTFHKLYQDVVTEVYLKQVVEEGKEILFSFY